MKRLVIAAVAVLLLCQCGQKDLYEAPEFKEETTGKFEKLGDDLAFTSVNKLYVHKNSAVVVAYDFKTKDLVHLYDLNTGRHIKSAVKRGRGPNESLSGQINSYYDEKSGMLTLYDYHKKAIISCDIDKLLQDDDGAITEETLHPDKFLRIFPLNDYRYLLIQTSGPKVLPQYFQPRFRVCDEIGEVLFSSDEYPYEENSWMRSNLYFNAIYSVSPDKDKIVVGTTYGLVMETFDITETSIERRGLKYFYEPNIGNETKMNTKNTIRGIGDFSTTQKLIVCAYDGENYNFDEPTKVFRNIAVFDWKCKPLYHIRMDCRIEDICYSENTNTIYAIVLDSDSMMYLAKFNTNKLKL